MLPLSQKMEQKCISKRKNTSIKSPTNSEITPAKLRKKELPLEKLTKQKIIEKFQKLEEEYLNLVVLNKKNEAENKLLKENVIHTGSKINNKYEFKTIETQTEALASTQTLMKDEEFPYPCKICTYNTDNPLELSVHMEHAHDDDDYGTQNPEITCNRCNKTCPSKNKLMEHINISHKSSVPACKYFQNDTCKYNEKSCWFVHKKVEISEHKCRYCEYKCTYRSEIMNHQKTSHEDKLQICKYYIQNNCKFREKCWYKHIDIAEINDQQ